MLHTVLENSYPFYAQLPNLWDRTLTNDTHYPGRAERIAVSRTRHKPIPGGSSAASVLHTVLENSYPFYAQLPNLWDRTLTNDTHYPGRVEQIAISPDTP